MHASCLIMTILLDLFQQIDHWVEVNARCHLEPGEVLFQYKKISYAHKLSSQN